MHFNELQLDPLILRAVEAAGFTTPTPIQEKAIPIVLSGADLMASAQTGTGKTAAFVLPTLHRLLQPAAKPGRGPRVLVLTPTRELAAQVDADIQKFGKSCNFTAGNIVGGVGYAPQIKLLKRPLDLLVATPGRFMDHMGEGLVDFSRLEVFILDEADRMLDMGFVPAVRKIVAPMPKKRQTLLFSATLEGQVLNMAQEILDKPERIQLAVNSRRHDNIAQHVYLADDAAHKQALLEHHLKDESMKQAVVFTRTKRRADRLATRLSRGGFKAAPLHGDMRQGARKKTIAQMKANTVSILVATDVAARGLDIKDISHVINFDLPMVAEDYIHRIGRTGRAGASGKAASLVSADEWELLTAITKLTGWELPRETIPGLEPRTQEPRKGASKKAAKKQSKQRPNRNRRNRGGGAGGSDQPSTSRSGEANPTAKKAAAKKRRFRRPPSKKRAPRRSAENA